MFHTGYVDNFTLVIEPASTNGPDPINIVFGVNPGRFFYVPVNVPFDAYNMEICVSEIQPIPNDPIEIYVRQGTRPTTNTYDFATNTMPPGLCLNIGLGDTPPLTPGRWFIGIYNPATNPRETMRLRVTFSRQAIPGPYFTYTSTDTPKTLLDDAVTNSTILVTNRGRISDLRVGLRVDHERASDLVFHLVSPSRTRLLLMENRGRTNALGIGANVTNIVTNVVRQVFNNGFENARQQLYVAGNKVSGWNVDSGQVDVMTFVTNTGTRFDGAAPHSGTNMLDSRGFIPGSISTNVLLQPLKTYRLSFAFCRNPDSRTVIYNNVVPEADVRVAGTNLIHIYADQINTWSNMNWQTTSVVFQASVATNKMEIVSVGQGADASGVMFDTVRIDEIEIKTNLYIYTTFTENTNLTDTPIKFGQPPYTNSVSPLSRPVLDDGFDFGYNGTAPFGFSGCCISGWTVESGDIDVIVDNGSGLGRPADTPPFAIDSGGDGAGVVVTNLFLERGADYTLSFAFSKGDTNAFFTPQAEVELTGVGTFLVTAVNGAGWDQTNIDFTAQSAATTLRLRSFNAGSGVYFDSFKIRRKAFSSSVADAYFLPEESIKPFFGQQAYGPWTLEVWDNRLGGAVTGTPQLVSWKLDIAFVPTNPPFVRLTNGSSVTAWVTNDAVLYFSVDVPCTEGFATNTLSCLTPTTVNGLNLTFNQYVLPTNGPNDVLLLSGVTQPLSPSNAVLTIGQAPLVSATRYYLAVANVNPAETNEFQIAINFACVPPAIGLSNYVCYSNRIASGEFQIYQYTVRPNVVQATFEITDSTGDTDLYLRAGARPTLFRYDYATNTPNWGNEVIAVGTNSIPTPINTVFAGGLWYIGVTNATTNALPAPVTYCIKVTEIVAPEIRQFVLVSDGACGGSNTVNTGSTGFADYYLVTIPPNPQNALFQVDVNQGAADLFVRNDFWPTTNSQPRSIGMSTEQIFLNPGSTPIPLSAGDWFISVIHPNPTTFVNHDLFISISATCPSPFIESSSSSYTTDGFALKWNAPASQEFEVQYTDTLSPVNWTTITKVTSTNGQFEFLDTGARTNTAGQRFYRLLRVQ
jgi:subtilisin-like proprotein convertase family protein